MSRFRLRRAWDATRLKLLMLRPIRMQAPVMALVTLSLAVAELAMRGVAAKAELLAPATALATLRAKGPEATAARARADVARQAMARAQIQDAALEPVQAAVAVQVRVRSRGSRFRVAKTRLRRIPIRLSSRSNSRRRTE